jgi:hypothetical protein
MPYADLVEIRNLIGNKTIKNSAGADITSVVLDDAQVRGDSRVNLETGYTTWINTDNFYASVQEASEYLAAAYILERYFDDKEKGMMFYQKGLDICYSLAKGATQSVIVATKAYRTFPLNPDADIHRSIPAGASDNSSTLEG